MRGRRIAFDYGDSRIGVAICDPDGILATPLPYLDSRHPKLMTQISSLLMEYEPIAIYIGKPFSLSGSERTAVEKVEKFVGRLREISPLTPTYVDERMTTLEAQRKLNDAGKNSKDSRLLIDSMAAVAILEAGLARENR